MTDYAPTLRSRDPYFDARARARGYLRQHQLSPISPSTPPRCLLAWLVQTPGALDRSGIIPAAVVQTMNAN